MARLARKRHLRHSDYDRTHRSTRLRAFLAARAEDLEETGSDYEFTIDGGTPAVEAEAAQGQLTVTTDVTATDTITVGSTTYTMVASDPGEDEIEIGVDAPGTAANIAAALDAREDVDAEVVETTIVLVTAAEPGEDGNSIATTATVDTPGALVWAETTLTGGVDAADAVPSTGVVTITEHGLEVGDGPFAATSSGDLPAGMTEGQFFWVLAVLGDDTLTLTTARDARELFAPVDAGSGTHELIKADSSPAIYEYLRQNAPEVVRDAEDVDDL